MTTQHTEPDENETAVRAALHRLGARPTGHAVDDTEQQSVPVAVVIPPRPEYEPTVGMSGPRRVRAPRLPDWRDPHKPELDVVDDEPENADGEFEDVEDEPEEQPAESRGRRLLRLVKGERNVPDDSGEQGPPQLRKVSKEPAVDQGEEPEDDGGEDPDDEVRRVGEGSGRKPRGAAPSGYRRPRFTTPAIPRQEKDRRSLVEAVREMRPETKWAAFHLSGLAAGFAFGIPLYAKDVAASLDHSPLPLRENPAAYFWSAALVLVLAVDRATRRWHWLVAWCTRGVTTSVVIGAVLNGNPIPH
ncbi:hypothetical protein [Streptomyces griseoruber]|uniref:hypothetical protein n=1 Tax=Streptomyces griseoruber TaxID=1943 RepID=UPI0037995ADB